MPDKSGPPFGRGHPRPVCKRRIMSNVLGMSTFEVRYPVVILILMEAHNPLQHFKK
jgi:hypothetical protein